MFDYDKLCPLSPIYTSSLPAPAPAPDFAAKTFYQLSHFIASRLCINCLRELEVSSNLLDY